MNMKRLLSLLLSFAMVAALLCCPITSSATEDFTYKLEDVLAEKLDDMSDDDTVDVSVWFNEMDDETVNNAVLAEVTQAVENDELNSAVLDLYSTDVLGAEESNTTVNADTDEIQALIALERSVRADLNNINNEGYVDELVSENVIDEEEITYIDTLLPNVEMTLTKSEIYSLIENDNVESVYTKGEITFEDTAVTESNVEDTASTASTTYDVNNSVYQTTGIADMKESYDGEGINIGLLCDGVPNDRTSCLKSASIDNDYHDDIEDTDGTIDDYSDLATFVAAQIVGSYGSYEGIATEASLFCMGTDTSHWKEDVNNLVYTKGVNILSLYFEEVGTSGTYGDVAKWLDAISVQENVVIIQPTNVITSATEVSGSVSEVATAYNSISVGAYDISTSSVVSSSAYLNSGAYKPDVVAPYNMTIYKNGTTYATGTNSVSSAGLVTGAVALLIDAQSSSLLTHPELTKTLIINGASYLGTENTINSSTAFVAYSRQSGAGVINVDDSNTNYLSRQYSVGTLKAGVETSCGSFTTSSGSKQMHVTICSMIDNDFQGDGNVKLGTLPTVTLTVKNGTNTWTSTCTVDNKCSVVFTTTLGGTFYIYATSTAYTDNSALAYTY